MKKALLLTVIVILFPAPARASCVQPPPLEQAIAEADVVFVGAVEAISNRGRSATVTVESVWKGPGLPGDVEIRGGPAKENVAASNDRHFEDGTRYLFIPTNRRPPFMDNACTQTQRYSPALDDYRPQADARIIDEFDLDTGLVGAIAGVLAVAAIAFYVIRALRSHTD